MTVAELLVAGVPAILVPVARGPAETTRRATPRPWWAWGRPCTCRIPSATAGGWPRSSMRSCPIPQRLRAMGEAARGHAHPDAAARVAELVDAHAR